MMKEILFRFAEEIDGGHIHIMHECQREHDTASHKRYRADEHRHRGHLLPGIDHDGSVAEIEEVVAGEEEFVDIVAEVVVVCQYLVNVAVAVSVSDPAYSDRDDEGDEEVDYVSQNVHSSRLSKQISKNHYGKIHITGSALRGQR